MPAPEAPAAEATAPTATIPSAQQPAPGYEAASPGSSPSSYSSASAEPTASSYPPPPAYQAPPVYAAPPAGGPAPIPLFRPALLGRADLLAVLRDALAPLLITLLLTFGIVVGLAWLASSTGHGGFHDWFTGTVVLVAGALGAPANLTVSGAPADNSGSGPGSGLFDFSLSLNLTISLVAWTITFLLFFLWMRRARSSEAASPSASPLQLAARSALPALGVSVALLVLALVSNASDVFNLVGSLTGGLDGGSGSTPLPGGANPFGGGAGSGNSGAAFDLGTVSAAGNGLHSSVGVSPGWVFFGPLLIAFAAFLIGRLTTVARRPVGDPGGEWVRKLTASWRGSARIVWTQLRAVGVLAGLAVLIYAEYHVLTADGSSGREKAAQAVAAVLLLPNQMIGGALTGFCVTLSNGVTLGLTGTQADQIGLFGNSRPWLVYVLIAAAVLGTALPWFLVRTRRRVVNAAAFAPIQVWRAAVLGAIAGLVVGILGQIAVSGSSGLGSLGMSTRVGLIYSVFGAVVAGAIWCAAAYLALAFLVTPRRPSAVAGGAQPPGSSYTHAWPGARPVPHQGPAPEQEAAAQQGPAPEQEPAQPASAASAEPSAPAQPAAPASEVPPQGPPPDRLDEGTATTGP